MGQPVEGHLAIDLTQTLHITRCDTETTLDQDLRLLKSDPLARELEEAIHARSAETLTDLAGLYRSGVASAAITCPFCAATRVEEMPENACQHLYRCTGCGKMLTPQPGDCCVFCSYADANCPPRQAERLA